MWKYFYLFLLLNTTAVLAQDIELYSQFNGKYDYTAIGNTMNTAENGAGPCVINTSSQANLALEEDQDIAAAYLYWAGTGSGDFSITLNNNSISAERTFSASLDPQREFFAAFADVTQQVVSTGNGTYEVSNLDLTNVIGPYCPTGGNFAGWAITIIYEDEDLPLNQLNVYDGLQSVSQYVPEITILIDNMNVLDNDGAKIGFVAWEGDAGLAVNETLQVNGNVIGNPPLNPTTNAFNGTNSFTGQDDLYNMDIDFYDIQNNINIGDTSVEIKLTSGQDFVMVNNIITVLNSQVPDASVSIVDHTIQCGNEEIVLDFQVHNTNSTDELPAGTGFEIQLNGETIATGNIPETIPIGGTWESSISLGLDNPGLNEYSLDLIVDPDNLVNEINEDNNIANLVFNYGYVGEILPLPDMESCIELDNAGIFDLTEQNDLITAENDVDILFFTSLEDAEAETNEITDPDNYDSQFVTQEIFVRYGNAYCFEIASFMLETINCPVPDASVEIVLLNIQCYSREATVNFTIHNTNCTGALPSGTEIAFFANENYLGSTHTQEEIPIDGNLENSTDLSLPESMLGEVEINILIDPGNLVAEIDEDNNGASIFFELKNMPPVEQLPSLLACNEGNMTGIFDLSQQNDQLTGETSMDISFFTSFEDAEGNVNEIYNPTEYVSATTPQMLYMRYAEDDCYNIANFVLETENCPPFVPQGFSPNGDGINDTFEISGLYEVFTNFELSIYSRLGTLVYTADNDTPEWDGTSNSGISASGEVPTGTYYYVLKLNDPDYDIITGWVYLNR